MRSLRAAERLLTRAEQALLTFLVAFMVALAFLQVALRQLGLRTGLSLSVLWGDTLLRHLVLWVGFLGAALAAASDKQFAMDALGQALSGRAKARAALPCHAFAACVCAALTAAAWTYLGQERLHGGTLFAVGSREVPTWWLEAIAPAGFALLLLHYALKTIEAAIEGFGARTEGRGASGP